MTSRLPPEILKNIFQIIYGHKGCYRSDEHLNNLFSCLLVNKEWCESAIPILWSEVFYPIQTIRIGTITTYLSCLNLEKRKTLQNQAGVNIPIQYDRPTFNYASQLTELNFDKFLKTIFSWCKKYRKPYRNTKRNEFMIRSLLELFSSNCANIKYFAMNNVPNYRLYDDYYDNLVTIDFKLLTEPNIRDCLSGVKELRLEWDTLVLNGFLTALSHTCRSLETLDTNFAHDPEFANLFISKEQAEDLAILISAQSNLQKFILQDYQNYTHYFLNSLNTQTLSLKVIEFYSVDFLGCISFEVFKNCHLLTHITFEDCSNITVDMVKPLLNASFPNLKYVHVYNNPDYYDPPCEDLVKWADKKNFKGKWWQIKLNDLDLLRIIKYFIYFIFSVFSYWLFKPFIMGLANILLKYLSWKLGLHETMNRGY
ncbi:hypothetical protein C1645_769120 [Glomus cerebriforme]|uniref:Uncharacterized protein n=1 Tax=Glomus cerebriforme TaxID=658196 RepID=A0A397T1M2_9GLOM|nr:hypothetical protein C1645_769120 [Glomus cerebriforme]